VIARVCSPIIHSVKRAVVQGNLGTYRSWRGHVLAPKGKSVRDDPALQVRALMAWIMLIFAGLLEVLWAFAMKLSDGFSRPKQTAVMLAAMVASFALLAASMRTLPLGTAYTVWTGIGALGTFVVGIVFLGEPANVARVVAAALIALGLAVMKLASAD
jgi:quaternary ammonium compound-resistance protein SugE